LSKNRKISEISIVLYPLRIPSIPHSSPALKDPRCQPEATGNWEEEHPVSSGLFFEEKGRTGVVCAPQTIHFSDGLGQKL
jgi:hypothetical protein